MKFPALVVPKSPDFYVLREAECKVICVHGTNKGKTIESRVDSNIFKHGYYSSMLKMAITDEDQVLQLVDLSPQELEQYGIEEMFVTALNFRKVQAKASDNRIYNLANTFYDRYTKGCIDVMLEEINKTMMATIKLYKKDEDIIHIEYDTSRNNDSTFRLTEGLVLDFMM